MSGDGADLHLDKESATKFTKGLNSTIDELGDLDGATGSVMGKGFSSLAITGMEAGHHGVSVDFEDFLRARGASGLADRLGRAAGTQWENDQYLAGTLKVGASAVFGGNPHASEEEIAKQDWGDIFTPDYLDPDYSPESFEKADQDMGQTWRDTGRTVLTEGYGGRQSDMFNSALGISDEQFNQSLDDTLGPSPEERAEQARQQGESGE
ncbi:hypothetical protein [Streptomyces sp. NBC_01438]|uniref:hypothetical protein n=1 Tax=Streptomyces sp. NBC_01438 TaxID=2903866 RepID=UPI00324AAFE5